MDPFRISGCHERRTEVLKERWCVGGKSDAQYQYQVRWTNGVTRWDSRENLLRYSCCRKLLEERPIPTALSAEDQGYHGKIKYIVMTPKKPRDIECTIRVEGAVAPVTSKKKKQQLSLRAEGQKTHQICNWDCQESEGTAEAAVTYSWCCSSGWKWEKQFLGAYHHAIT